MTSTVAALVAPFEAAARAAEVAEQAFRRDIRSRIEMLERERSFAFRRMNLLADLGEAAGAAADPARVPAAISARLGREFGLEPGRPAHARILDRFGPVAVAVAAALAPASTAEATPPDVAGELAAFEAWYLAETGSPFFALADVHRPESPLVDW